MAMQGQSSFRRILLSRILLLSIPILLLGVAVTFRKARTSLLLTARQNLVESAKRKADVVQSSISALKTSLAIASQTSVLQSGSIAASQTYLKQLVSLMPADVSCLQLTNAQTNQVVASTCGDRPIAMPSSTPFPKQQQSASLNLFQLKPFVPSPSTTSSEPKLQSQLNLIIGRPIYDPSGQLRYTLTAHAIVTQMENAEPWSLLGYTVIIDQNGTFLSHPMSEKVGQNISQMADATRLQDILANGLRGENTVRHLFGFIGDQSEWLAGFSPVVIPVSPTENHIWVVLAVTPLSSALEGLKSITQILFILTTGLLAAHLLAMLYMARDLSLPIEQLGRYARRLHQRGPLERAPKNFKIRELNQLASVLDNMVRRLEERARELESAWQEAETANQLKSEFLANTSHELRTPLNAIIGCIRLVQDGCCDSQEEEREFLEQADKAAVHLLKIINDLLDIRRIEERGLSLSMEVIDIRDIFKEVVTLQIMQIQQKGLRLTVEDLPAPVMVRADPARLKQVLLNVIYNSIKFTDTGGITIRTTREMTASPIRKTDGQNRRQDDDGLKLTPQPWIIISVEDTGIGIDPAQQHKLFRPFVMIDGTTTRKYEGTGLGLAISRNLVEMMGGRIALHSDGIDQGTTVEIAFPMVSDTQTSSQSTGEPSTQISAPA